MLRRDKAPGPPVSQATDFRSFLSREDFGRLAEHYVTAGDGGFPRDGIEHMTGYAGKSLSLR